MRLADAINERWRYGALRNVAVGQHSRNMVPGSWTRTLQIRPVMSSWQLLLVYKMHNGFFIPSFGCLLPLEGMLAFSAQPGENVQAAGGAQHVELGNFSGLGRLAIAVSLAVRFMRAAPRGVPVRQTCPPSAVSEGLWHK